MRVKEHSSYPRLFNLDESKKDTDLPYPRLFNLNESKRTLALSQDIQPG
jgi:hypothetical protein